MSAPHRQLAGRIVIATHNPGKLREMRELLAPYGIDAISAAELGLGEPDETGTSFQDNARIKAQAAASATGLPAFADDSGLAVDALGADKARLVAKIAGGQIPELCRVGIGDLHGLDEADRFDTILYIDVLEHIEEKDVDGVIADALHGADHLEHGRHGLGLPGIAHGDDAQGPHLVDQLADL